MIYELRTYQVAAGRMADMDRLLSQDCTPVMRRSAIPRPLGAWHALAGPRTPAFIWLLAWKTLDERNAAWGAFGADSQWQQLRREAHEESELTVRVDTQFLAAWPQLTPAGDADLSKPGAVYELSLMRIHSGMGGAARQSFLEHDKPVLETAGGHLEAGFDLLSGEELPSALVLTRWANLAAYGAAMASYGAHPSLRAARVAEYAKHGVDVFGSADKYLLASSSPFGRD